MADSLSDARDALRRNEPGEAVVHLWNAFEEARGLGDQRAFGRIARLAREAKEEGDEGERAEADRLLRELGGDAEPDFGVDDEWIAPHGEPAPADTPPAPARESGFETTDADHVPDDEEPQERKRGAGLAWLIPIAIFLFITFRDAFG